MDKEPQVGRQTCTYSLFYAAAGMSWMWKLLPVSPEVDQLGRDSCPFTEKAHGGHCYAGGGADVSGPAGVSEVAQLSEDVAHAQQPGILLQRGQIHGCICCHLQHPLMPSDQEIPSLLQLCHVLRLRSISSKQRHSPCSARHSFCVREMPVERSLSADNSIILQFAWSSYGYSHMPQVSCIAANAAVCDVFPCIMRHGHASPNAGHWGSGVTYHAINPSRLLCGPPGTGMWKPLPRMRVSFEQPLLWESAPLVLCCWAGRWTTHSALLAPRGAVRLCEPVTDTSLGYQQSPHVFLHAVFT